MFVQTGEFKDCKINGNEELHSQACSLENIKTNRGFGGIDHMMKNSINSIVKRYVAIIQKRGYAEFPKGKYEIRLALKTNYRPGPADVHIVIPVTVL